MTTIADLHTWMDHFAPRRLAESWDNVGLLMGDPAAPVERVMTCLTVTAGTAAEAIEHGAAAIVSHHPILFKGTKHLRADRPETGFLWQLARAGVAVLSPHTAFDNTQGGINDGLACRLGLQDVTPLRPSPPEAWYKLVVFAPDAERDAILQAAFNAGAGGIGHYSECSFTGSGIGTFRGGAAANPTIGQPGGPRESVPECRVEVICPAARRESVVAAIRAVHSYEEPAIDQIPIESIGGPTEGAGRIGTLPQPEPLGALAARVASLLHAPGTQWGGDPARLVRRVALCCGAGDSLLADAHKQAADVYLTGEARYHSAAEAHAWGLGLIVAGHHATERPGVEDLAERIAGEFPHLTVWASQSERDPLQWGDGTAL